MMWLAVPTVDPGPIDPDKEFCAKVKNQVSINVGKRGKIQRMGENSFTVRVKQPVNKTRQYTALVTFTRNNCGIDFITKLENGKILVDFQDGADGDSIFHHVDSYYRKDGERYVMQFDKIGNCKSCIGSNKVDSYEMIVMGIKDVKWGNKDAKKCLALAKHAFIGHKDDPELRGFDSDMIKCVAWQKLSIEKKSSFSNWGK